MSEPQAEEQEKPIGEVASPSAAPAQEADPDHRPAGRSIGAWITLLVVCALGLGADLWTKAWAFRTVAGRPVELVFEQVVGNPRYPLPWHDGVRALPGDLLDFRLVLNHGAVFGVGQNRQRIFIGFTIVAAIVALGFFARWTRSNARLAHIAIGMILAGGFGNLYDRLTVGAVRDFLHIFPRWTLPGGLKWPNNPTNEVFPWIFNIADVLLLAGMAMFMIYAYGRDRHAPPPLAQGPGAT